MAVEIILRYLHFISIFAITKYFNQREIFHPDDMYGIILTSYYRQLRANEIKLNEQIEHYKKY